MDKFTPEELAAFQREAEDEERRERLIHMRMKLAAISGQRRHGGTPGSQASGGYAEASYMESGYTE